MRQALDRLRREHLIESIRGSGTFVRADPPPMPVVPLARSAAAMSHFLHGRGQYIGDLRFARMREVAFVRSPVAHAKLTGIRMPDEFPSGNVTFNVTNTGDKTHTFKISGQGVDVELPEYLRPGESATLQVALKPGRYRINCPITPHPILGMRRTVTVTEATT